MEQQHLQTLVAGTSDIILCPLGCREEISRRNISFHVAKECIKRIIPCEYGCDEIIQAGFWKEHEIVCKHKKYPCGYGSASCTRSLSNWFRYDGAGCEHLIQCKHHQSSVFMWAIVKGQMKLLAYIFDKLSSNIFESITLETNRGDTALTQACKHGKIEIVRLLLHKLQLIANKRGGFSLSQFINHETSRGKIALVEASCNNHVDVIKFLLTHHASTLIKSRAYNLTALEWAYKLGKEDVINELLKAFKTEYRIKQLFILISLGKLDIIKKIIDGGEKYRLNHLNLLELELQNLVQKETNVNLMQAEEVQAKTKELLKKIEVARIMAFIVPNGHTVLSWACAVGNVDVVRELLKKGATVGYGDDYFVWSARIIQAIYRDHHWKARNKCSVVNLLQRRFSLTCFIKTMSQRMFHRRSAIRSPLGEAFFNGNASILKVFQDENIAMGLACKSSLLEPSGILPRHNNILRGLGHTREETKKILSLADCARLGRNMFQTPIWIHGVGWKGGKKYLDDKYNQTVFVAESLVAGQLNNIHLIHSLKKKKRLEKAKQISAIKWNNQMEQSINAGDFVGMINCAKNGVDINTETKEGITPLMRAAMEDADALNHCTCTNEAGEPVSAVSYLLDRLLMRPSVDYESKRGYTALAYACLHGRLNPARDLLIRGAIIDQQMSTTGLTPLMIVSIKGKDQIAKLLIDNGADIYMNDHRGKNAFDLALEHDSLDTLALLENAKRGSILRASAGRNIYKTNYPCQWGCGFFDTEEELKLSHEFECIWRYVDCEFCDISNLRFKDKNEHENEICKMRPKKCMLCKNVIPLIKMPEHTRIHCKERFVTCSQCMDTRIKASQINSHSNNKCSHRRIPCRYSCGKLIPKIFLSRHEKRECPNRPIRCFSCNSLLMSKDKSNHDDFSCIKREISCKYCKNKIRNDEMHLHIQNCMKSIVNCNNSHNGCKWSGPKTMLTKHLACSCDYMFKEKCPLGCSIMLRKIDIESHITHDCDRREILCVLCGETIVAASQKSHLKFKCVMKIPQSLRIQFCI